MAAFLYIKHMIHVLIKKPDGQTVCEVDAVFALGEGKNPDSVVWDIPDLVPGHYQYTLYSESSVLLEGKLSIRDKGDNIAGITSITVHEDILPTYVN